MKMIGSDETMVAAAVDVTTGRVIDVLEGHDAADLQAWPARTPAEWLAGIEVVSATARAATARRWRAPTRALARPARSRERQWWSTRCCSTPAASRGPTGPDHPGSEPALHSDA